MSPLFVSLVVLALTSFALWFIRPHRFRHIGWVAALPPAAITGYLITTLPAIAAGQDYTATYLWAPALGLELALRLDGLGVFFGLIVAGIGTGIALYTGYYFEGEKRLGFFYGQIFLFMASMLGLVWADNLLAVYVFWEGTSITSYLLIGFKDTDKDAQAGARQAFLVTAIGGLSMLFGFVMLGSTAGTYSISAILNTPGLTAAPLMPLTLSLIFLGAFTKSAQFPFHFWLPGAMAAPTPASAYLHSATMVKAGIYLLARLHPALADHPLWFWALLLVGGTTMLVGAITAMGQHDMKALLAYATVSQLGILVMLLAFSSSVAYIAVVTGILAHSLYKGPLFLVAGIVDHATGTRDLRRLSHLYRELPLVTAVAVLAGLSMASIPPTFGFLAKEGLLETFTHWAEDAPTLGTVGLIVAAVGGALFVSYTLVLLWEGFGGAEAADTDEVAHVHHRPSFSFILAPLALTLISLGIPFVLSAIEGLIFAPPASAIRGSEVEVHLALWHGFTPVLMTSLAAIATGVAIFFLRSPLRRGLAAWPRVLNGTNLYDKVVYSLYDLATWSTRQIQGGTLAQQVTITLLVAVAALAYALRWANWPADFRLDWGNTPPLAVIILTVLAAAAAVITVQATTRLSAIISLGVIGFAVTVFFIFHSAPDLALTQLLVDILTVVLLVLVFYRIPPRPRPPLSLRVHTRNLMVALAMGLFGFFLVLIGAGDPFFPRIADYFLLNSVALGHGGNVVNVILVDFRGFDTMGEISVLAIAAVGGYAIMRSGLLRLLGPDRPQPPTEDSVVKE